MSFKIRSLTLGCALALVSASAFAATTTVRVIAFNDFHGNLQSPGNFGIQPGGSGSATTSKPAGGVDYLAGYVDYLKTGYANTVVVSAGDLTGASPLISGAFHDEPAIETMNLLGLEFNAVGNHEFDYGTKELFRKQRGGCYPGGVEGVDTCLGASSTSIPVSVQYPFRGAQFKYLAANVSTPKSSALIRPYGIKTFVLSATKPVNRLKVAFIGMTLKSTPTIVTPTGVAGLTFNDEVQTVNALIPELKAKGVESIVVLIHQGGFQGSTGPNYINDCSLASNGTADAAALEPLRSIVKGLDDAVDLVVSGHTHTGYTCQLPNKVGRNIPVTQGGNYGRVVTSIDLSIDTTTKDVIGSVMNNTVVDRTNPAITPNAAIKSIVDAYAANISPIANQVVAAISAPVVNNDTANGGSGEKPAGDLIADGMLAATSPAKFGGAQIAFTNAGGVRADYSNKAIPAVYPYNLTYGDAFTVQPFGNNMVTMTVTAQQLKDALEMQFPGNSCELPSGTNKQVQQRVLQPSNGFKVSWSATAANCNKIQDVSLTSYDSFGTITNVDQIVSAGAVLNPTQTYRVTVNSFLATGGDAFSVFNFGTNRIGGAQDIDATVAYLAQFKTPNVYDPAASSLHLPRIVKLP